MSLNQDDCLTLSEVLRVCRNIKNTNIEIMRDNLIRPKTVEFLENYEIDDDRVKEIIKNLDKEDYYQGPVEDINPKFAHPFWIFIKKISNLRIKVYIKIKIINHKRKIIVFSIHEEGKYEI
ncbi:MAG: type II toxin-antitoxin system MqsR family toxin [Bacilli bacterium]|nr:type II toxin-antitoxin system MqsR family toxin [Bacilli bacterium]